MGRWRQRPPIEMVQSEDDSPDVELVRRFLADSAEFTAIFDRHWESLFRYCYYLLGDWSDAEEAAQSAMLKVSRGLERFEFLRGEGSLRAFVIRIGRNEAISVRRSVADRPTLPFPDAAPLVDRGPTPEELAISAASHDEIRRLLLELD